MSVFLGIFVGFIIGFLVGLLTEIGCSEKNSRVGLGGYQPIGNKHSKIRRPPSRE